VHRPKRPELVAAIGSLCPYCGEPMTLDRPPTRDRLIPGKRGGSYEPENIVIACEPCNTDRGAWSLRAFSAALAADGDPRAVRVAVLVATREAEGKDRI
jgi:5-methylcytosine-specific restriction endonuclease McrA